MSPTPQLASPCGRFTLSIRSDRQKLLPIYNPSSVDGSAFGNIESMIHSTYSVRITGPSQTDSIDCPTYSYGVVIDGKEVVNRFARAGRGGKVEVRGYKTPDGVKAFKFSEPILTEVEDGLDALERAGLGAIEVAIEVRVRRKFITEEVLSRRNMTYVVWVSEGTKKGRLDCMTRFGPVIDQSQSARRLSTHQEDQIEPFATLKLYYMTRDLLQANDIIPRRPGDLSSDQRRFGERTFKELDLELDNDLDPLEREGRSIEQAEAELERRQHELEAMKANHRKRKLAEEEKEWVTKRIKAITASGVVI